MGFGLHDDVSLIFDVQLYDIHVRSSLQQSKNETHGPFISMIFITNGDFIVNLPCKS